MFTGIVKHIGKVKMVSRRGLLFLLELESDIKEKIDRGDSIAVNGACLTVIKNIGGELQFEIMPETFSTTNLQFLKPGDKVNLELSLKAGERVSGHFVSGHVDCMGVIRKRHYVRNNLSFEIAVPPKYMSFVLLKGSVAIDGISLTVSGKRNDTLSVYVIPHTLNHTILKDRTVSQKVNVEFDILSKRP